jgi:hypothetical protein
MSLGIYTTILVILIAVGLYDLYLVFKKQKTISQRIHDLFPKWIDAAIMIGLLILTWWIGGIYLFVPVMCGIIVGHLFWQE